MLHRITQFRRTWAGFVPSWLNSNNKTLSRTEDLVYEILQLAIDPVFLTKQVAFII